VDGTQTATTQQAAGFGRRLVSAIVDGVLLGVVGVILRAIFGGAVEAALSLVLSLAYFTYFHGKTGQTPGNAALGIRVVDIDSGSGPIGYGRAALRWLVSIVSAIVLLVGFLWMLWDPRKQTWHDKAARSLPVTS
jgi:uncharacterized RDD family membrane protein YckC